MEDESEELDLGDPEVDLDPANQELSLDEEEGPTGQLGPLDKTGELEIDGEKTQDLDLGLDEDSTGEFNLDSTDTVSGEEQEEIAPGPKGLSAKFPFLQKLSDIEIGFGKKKKPEDKKENRTEEQKKIPTEGAKESQGPIDKSKLEAFFEKNLPSLAPLASKMSSLGAKKNNAPKPKEGEEEKLDESGKPVKPKRQIRVIHILIILGGVFILFMDDFTTESPDDSATQAPKIVPKYKKKPKVEKPAEESPAEVRPDPEPTSEPEPAPEPEPTPEPKPEPAPEPEQTPEPEPSPEPEPTPVEPVQEIPESSDSDLDSMFEEEEITSSETDETETESEEESDEGEQDPPPAVVVEPAPSELDDVSPNKSPSEEFDIGQQIIDEVAEPGGGEEITEAILKQLESNAKERRDQTINVENAEPTAAPTYIDPGAGLVYNCQGKHWACVSEPSFQQCGQNYAWHLKEGSNIECYPSEVYESPMDCAGMQQYKIDMAVETEFCSR